MNYNNETTIVDLHNQVKDKLQKALAESQYYLDDIFEDFTVEELALIAAKVNHRLNLKLNSDFKF